MIKSGSSREIITPPRGVSLAGYFNPRPNTGILDELFVKVMLLEQDGLVAGLVSFDLCYLGTELIDRMKDELVKRNVKFGDNLIFCATHTHTGPQIGNFFGMEAADKYLDTLIEKTGLAVSRAHQNLAPAELLCTSVDENPFAFNRRYYMKNGTVLTNPGKCNPDIVRPEGPVDNEISIFAVKQDGRISAMAVNIVNHTDTIGGDLVSADWPGIMERAIQGEVGHELPVLTLVGCSGNINHFDVSSKISQTNYEEACRIGRGYAGIVLKSMNRLAPLGSAALEVVAEDMEIPFQVISDERLAKAKETLKRIGNTSSDKDMTSEGLATGDGPVAKFFAEQLVAYRENCSGLSRKFKIIAIRLGDKLSFLSMPGEPFTEIGQSIKKKSPCRSNFIISNAMGKCGYIPLEECFGRGGYEILPVVGGAPREDTAERIIESGIGILKIKLQGEG
ncbi:MAG TPA: hypothetical protein DET40_07225 [Lentisphaeria bacterium]|nr:MAG: hypothetical protein A2X45_07075 [Lentisphaerae bacterium GWF2_50_93]HCE43323.1 hypothetical protein [Lentisphaeria bacterium]